MRNLFVGLALICLVACNQHTGSLSADPNKAVSHSGVSTKTVSVKTDSQGWTSEQRNISEKLKRDNDPGGTQFLYVVSAYTHDLLFFSTVKGKVTSSGKRLTPTTVYAGTGSNNGWETNYGIPVRINGKEQYTAEVPQDDGTYGSSIDYLYWFDETGNRYQLYNTGIVILVSDRTLRFPKPLFDLATLKVEAEDGQ